ncbi:MAG: glycosyltransferase family 2 protein [Flavobacteriaceae bacterium]|nr:glycosyltransferase family 2 protein [Flavobacteriaceae bacterium]
MKSPKVSVIISTYNSPKWLTKTLWGYEFQNFKDFEIIIADDGSGPAIKEVINSFKDQFKYPIQHVWHEDDGFRKSLIINKSIIACNADYILMTDGDCIPRYDFVQTHFNYAKKGFFLSGGAIRLPMQTSKLIDYEDVKSQNAFDLIWLREHGLENKPLKNLKLTKDKKTSKFMNKISPSNASWNGGNASGWKKDILAVNGMDERMQYGGQDRELGERLMNYGLRGLQVRYSAVCVHLEHARGYAKKESIKKNKQIRHKTRSEKIVWTKFGIKK